MGNPKAFLTIHRKEAGYRPLNDRIHDFGEVEQTLNSHDRREQASRCMDCGVPFCHWACPLHNKAPEWNDAVYKGDWELAYRQLSSTNDFPEFTGRICPALCEKACVLNLMSHEPTTIREDECAIAEHAFEENYVTPRTPERNGHRVAVVGSGPAGLAAANQLNQRGYRVTVFEKAEAAGGLLRYGIPNFKLNKAVIDRRIALMEAEGIRFEYNRSVSYHPTPATLQLTPNTPHPSPNTQNPSTESAHGSNPAGHRPVCAADITVADSLSGTPIGTLNTYAHPDGTQGFDAVVIATGTPTARDLNVPGRELRGVHLALELLSQQNRVLAAREFAKDELVNAKGKNVLVIGGGDTGSDCIGTAHRQGCRSVTQIEIMPKPPVGPDDPNSPWPNWPRTLKTTSSHEEGCERRWNINTLEFLGKDGRLTGVRVQPIDWKPNPEGGRPLMVEAGEPEVIKCEMVLLAMGFLKPEQPTFAPSIFVAGDAARGASLVVRAIAEGREAAQRVDAFLAQ